MRRTFHLPLTSTIVLALAAACTGSDPEPPSTVVVNGDAGAGTATDAGDVPSPEGGGTDGGQLTDATSLADADVDDGAGGPLSTVVIDHEDGNLFITGTFTSPDFAKSLHNLDANNPHPFVVKIDPSGVIKGDVDFDQAGTGKGSCDALAVAGTNVFVGCTFGKTIAPPGATNPFESYGNSDVLFVSLARDSLELNGAISIGSANADSVGAITFANGVAVAAIRVGGATVKLQDGAGDDSTLNVTGPAALVIGLNLSMGLHWMFPILDNPPGSGSATFRALATYAATYAVSPTEQALYAAGEFSGSIVVNDTEKDAKGDLDGFVLHLSANPAPTAPSFGSFAAIDHSLGSVHVTSLSVGADGAVFVGGDHTDALAIGNSMVEASTNGQPQAFVLRADKSSPIFGATMQMSPGVSGDSVTSTLSGSPQLLWGGAFDQPMSTDAAIPHDLTPRTVGRGFAFVVAAKR